MPDMDLNIEKRAREVFRRAMSSDHDAVETIAAFARSIAEDCARVAEGQATPLTPARSRMTEAEMVNDAVTRAISTAIRRAAGIEEE